MRARLCCAALRCAGLLCEGWQLHKPAALPTIAVLFWAWLPQLAKVRGGALCCAAAGNGCAEGCTQSCCRPPCAAPQAEGGSWSPATHHYWPDAFKHALHALPLAANRTSGGACTSSGGSSTSTGGGSGSPAAVAQQATLACLPPGILLHIASLAAAPMSTWDAQGFHRQRCRRGCPRSNPAAERRCTACRQLGGGSCGGSIGGCCARLHPSSSHDVWQQTNNGPWGLAVQLLADAQLGSRLMAAAGGDLSAAFTSWPDGNSSANRQQKRRRRPDPAVEQQ